MHIDTGVTFRVAKCNIGDRCNYVMASPSTFSRGPEQRTHPDSKRSSPRSQTVQKGQRQLQRRVWILLRKRTCVGRRDVSLVRSNVRTRLTGQGTRASRLVKVPSPMCTRVSARLGSWVAAHSFRQGEEDWRRGCVKLEVGHVRPLTAQSLSRRSRLAR